jgi:isocitrate dehydrogenase
MTKTKLPEMVYISGEEMTRVVMQLILDKWINPNFDTSSWQFFDLSCAARDASDDKVLKDSIAAGAKIGAIFKEPTITPTGEQMAAMGLKKPLGSPNGKMRAGWNGYAISRDTIHIPGIELGYKTPVLMDRHAVGGEYGAGYKTVGRGKLITKFYGENGEEVVVDERTLTDQINAAVTYHNPYDNIADFGAHFFGRCLEANVTPYVVSKRTVFKWQEEYWQKMKRIFDADFKAHFNAKGLLEQTGGELRHLLSDDAAMKLVAWTKGKFGLACLNYDGDWLSDELAQMHKSPGFISSVLVGKMADGSKIMEFEASHGTIADQFAAHNAGKETSVNPLGLVTALIGAMNHSANLAAAKGYDAKPVTDFTSKLYKAMTSSMATGKGTRDLCGPSGLTTQGFIDHVGAQL